MKNVLFVGLAVLVACSSSREVGDEDAGTEVVTAPDTDSDTPSEDDGETDSETDTETETETEAGADADTDTDTDVDGDVDGDTDTDTDTDSDTDIDSDTDSDTDTDVDTGTGEEDRIQLCWYACEVPADCVHVDTDAFPVGSVDHWECNSGVCNNTGCKNDAECVASYNDTYGCNDTIGVPVCDRKCEEASDCVYLLPGGLYDTDNWACNSGFCKWTGCNSTEECNSGVSPGFETVCHENSDFSDVSFCHRKCTTAADCDTGSGDPYSESHWKCEDQACHWLGCFEDADCPEGVDYTCA